MSGLLEEIQSNLAIVEENIEYKAKTQKQFESLKDNKLKIKSKTINMYDYTKESNLQDIKHRSDANHSKLTIPGKVTYNVFIQVFKELKKNGLDGRFDLVQDWILENSVEELFWRYFTVEYAVIANDKKPDIAILLYSNENDKYSELILVAYNLKTHKAKALHDESNFEWPKIPSIERDYILSMFEIYKIR